MKCGPRGMGRKAWMNWEMRTDTYTLPWIKQTATGDSYRVQFSSVLSADPDGGDRSRVEGSLRGRGYMYTYS